MGNEHVVSHPRSAPAQFSAHFSCQLSSSVLNNFFVLKFVENARLNSFVVLWITCEWQL